MIDAPVHLYSRIVAVTRVMRFCDSEMSSIATLGIDKGQELAGSEVPEMHGPDARGKRASNNKGASQNAVRASIWPIGLFIEERISGCQLADSKPGEPRERSSQWL